MNMHIFCANTYVPIAIHVHTFCKLASSSSPTWVAMGTGPMKYIHETVTDLKCTCLSTVSEKKSKYDY